MNLSDLPPVGANAEHLGIDLKQEVGDPRNYQEMAKDVAAFANASGGVILVGAIEDRARRIVARYSPMERDLAKRVCDAFNHATRDLCSPKPVINPLIITS
jgi:predicted HTH transcriptional regulator